MKNSIKIVSLVLLFIAGQSCTDVLSDVEPSTATTQEVALGTTAGVKAVRASMYTTLFSFAYNTEYMIAPSSLADDLYITPGSNRFNGKNLNTPGNTVDFWQASYSGDNDLEFGGIIQTANLLIHAVEEGVIPDDLLKQYKAEAYFMRAFAFHNLARAFSYEPNSIPDFGQGAGFNLGIVLRLEPALSVDDIEFKGRATIEETYQQIESDLKTAIDLFSQVGDAGSVKYASQATAEALLARVYLYWEKWDLADQYATAALQHTQAELAEPSEIGSLFFDPTTTIEVIFRGYIADPNNAVPDPVNNGKAVYTSKQWMAQAPTQDLMDIYSSNDARLAWFRPCINELNGEPARCLATHPAIPSNRFGEHEKQGLELAKWDGSLSDNYSDHIPYFRVPEMLLIQAEARLEGAPGNALAPLNKLRESRNLKPLASISMEEILEARRREFVGEGHRFWDLKRLEMDIPKAPETLDDPGVNEVPYSARVILNNIPTDVVALSEENAPDGAVITQNPGY